MSLVVETSEAKALLAAIKNYIDEGHIKTWEYDEDGDFTHTAEQWKKKAWLRPSVEQGRLSFELLKANNVPLTNTIYGIYHGRFTEMLLTHFRDSLKRVTSYP
jgi:hypothetical protein